MPIHTVYTLSDDDAEARNWLSFLRRHGSAELSNLVIERVFWLEGEIHLEKLLPFLVNPLYQTAFPHSRLEASRGPVVEIAYRPAVTDPETPSILAAAQALGETSLAFARLSKRYQFVGLTESEACKLAARFLYNKVVERIRQPNEEVTTLRPAGNPDSVATVALRGLTDKELVTLSKARSWYAPLSQMKVIQTHEIQQGRPHTDAELEILVQSWSDHCYHTTWKSLGLLKRLSDATARIRHPLVVSAFKDNAGGLEFYEDWVVTIKGETHNFPSSIAPFGGIATKHGGVIRDTLGFGKGAYPIGGTTIMGTMDPHMPEEDVPVGALHPQLIVSESVRATAYYCNPMGIPMMHPIYRRHPGYAKCFALGHSVGLIPRADALKDRPQAGDVALLIGGETGRDGIHGATASSTGMTGETLEKESAAVQIGHPITERRFTTAIPILRGAGCIRALTDLGAGGISSAAGEIGAETGIALNLDAVPLKDQSLTAWEILLSESQERMLIVIPPEKLDEAQAILERFEVAHADIGRFTRSWRLEATWRGQQVVDLEMSFLWRGCPIDSIETKQPARCLQALNIAEPETAEEWAEAVARVLGHYHCADQSAAGSRFDTTVQGRTAVGPYGGRNHRMPTNLYVSAPLRGKPYGVITTVAFNPFYGEIDPSAMARLMVIEAITKAVVAGADYREMALCDNFYTARVRPEVAWDLEQMVRSIADFSVEIGVPFISGKDSSSGTFEASGRTIDVPPTLAVAVLGRVPDVRKIVTKEFRQPGNKLLLLGPSSANALGGSVYADAFGQRGDCLYDARGAVRIRSVWDTLLALHREERYVSGSAIAEGGMLLSLFESCLGSSLGARVELDGPDQTPSPPAPLPQGGEGRSNRNLTFCGQADGIDREEALPSPPWGRGAGGEERQNLLFGEFIGSALIEVKADDPMELASDIPCRMVGQVIEDPRLELIEQGRGIWQDSVSHLNTIWSKTFREVLE
jgi:phosphoribosylformylglycinamidine synthase